MRIGFVSPDTDGECRCQECQKLLAKIKDVGEFAIVEIKCTRAHCGLLNTFEIRKNVHPTRDKKSSSERVTFGLQRPAKMY